VEAHTLWEVAQHTLVEAHTLWEVAQHTLVEAHTLWAQVPHSPRMLTSSAMTTVQPHAS
jgi:purine-nucleoside phosphorylase